MLRVRRRQRLASALAFGLLALVAELAGRSLTHRLDVGRHVAEPSYVNAEYYPALLAAVKVGIALLLARLLWRVVRACAIERDGRRLLVAAGARLERGVPRVRVTLSPRLWLLSFAVTSVIYLVQADAEGLAAGRWPLLAPWLHSSALPIFAGLAVFVALAWGALARWLTEYEDYAHETLARGRRLAGRRTRALPLPRPRSTSLQPPRRLLGVVCESRPPPLPA